MAHNPAVLRFIAAFVLGAMPSWTLLGLLLVAVTEADNKGERKMSWKKEAPYDGPIYQGCLNCPPVEKLAPMDMLIGVGFGVARVTCDGKPVYQEPQDADGWDDFWTTAEAEKAAAADPNHDWRILLVAPLREREYQRHGPGHWVLINSGRGFA